MTAGNSDTTTSREGWLQGWSEVRLIAAIRWLLATTALTIIYLDPREPDNHTWSATYFVLAAFVIYSTVLYFFAIRRAVLLSGFEWWAHWIDVAWFTVLIGMSTGTNRIFFFGFLFAILVASFRRGFKAGISVVIVSTLAITIVGYTTETASPGYEGYGFDVYRFILRPIYLMVLGYLMAHWGESELESKRRLALLKDITLSNPRFGVDRTISSVLEKLRKFYDADVGLLIAIDPFAPRSLAYRAESRGAPLSPKPEDVPTELASALLALPPEISVCYNSRRWPSKKSTVKLPDGSPLGQQRDTCDTLANTLEAKSFISVPIFRHKDISGRLYFSKSKSPSFKTSDVEFLIYVMGHINPIIENIRLVDTLASDAADRERQRIARDIHDSIIQPYIGFQIALSGLRRKVAAGQVNLSTELEQLTEMTAVGVTDLRGYVSKLKNPKEQRTTLLPAIERFANTFSDATGIKVSIEAPSDLHLNDSLAAELFQMITEGLSNIRRHTEATNALVRIDFDDKRIMLRIENDGNIESSHKSFTPRSISERAAALSGIAWVENGKDDRTIVRIEVPL